MKNLLWVVLVILIVGCTNQNLQLENTKTPTPYLLTPTTTSAPFVAPTILIHTLDPISATQQSVIESCTRTERDYYTKFVSNYYFTNGHWAAYVCSDNGVYAKIVNGTLNSTWIIPAIDEDLSVEGAEWYWLPYFWSDDEKYLYLRPVCFCFIDSPWLIYSSGYGLSRLDLNTGELNIWLKPYHGGYSFEFSSDKKLFAYYPPDLSNTIKIKNLFSNEEKILSLKEKYIILGFRFTPDTSKLFILTEEYDNDSLESKYSIFIYNLRNDFLMKLVDKSNLGYAFPAKEFAEPPRIYISELTNEFLVIIDDYYGLEFKVNIKTGEWIKTDFRATPSSIP